MPKKIRFDRREIWKSDCDRPQFNGKLHEASTKNDEIRRWDFL